MRRNQRGIMILVLVIAALLLLPILPAHKYIAGPRIIGQSPRAELGFTDHSCYVNMLASSIYLLTGQGLQVDLWGTDGFCPLTGA